MSSPIFRSLPALAALAAGLAAWSTGAGAQSIPVSVGGGASAVVGTSVDVPLTVDMRGRSDKLGSFAIALRWNPAVLVLTGGREGTFGQVTVNEDSAATGLVQISGANPAGVGGLVTLVTGVFQALRTDTTTLLITVNDLYAATTFLDLKPSSVVTNSQYCPANGLYGDFDGDGNSDSRDALVALMASVGLNVTQYNLQVGDVDADGDVDPRDALVMLSNGVGLDVSAFRVLTLAPGGGCTGGSTPSHGLNPGGVTALVGQEIRYTLLSTVGGGPVSVSNVTWSSSNVAVASVDSVGHVDAIAPGSAVIDALKDGIVVGSATVSVVATRPTHWLDALASQSVNQLGTSALPFATLDQAVNAASPGDTIRIKSGRYEAGVTIDRRLVIIGDSTGGAPRPLIAANGTRFVTGLTLTATDRVELHYLALDTLYRGVAINGTDTVVVRDVDFQASAGALVGLYANGMNLLQVQRSRFFGDTRYTFGNDGIEANNVGVVSIDSSIIADHGYYGVSLTAVDSLWFLGNVVRDNYSYGVYLYNGGDSTKAVAAVVSGNRFERNGSYQLYLSNTRLGRFDHNVLRSSASYGSGFVVYGFSQTQLSFVADSFDARDYPWINAYRYDSLLIDSAVVHQEDDYGYFDDGRVTVIRNSVFTGLQYGGLQVDGSSAVSSRLIMRNVQMSGPDSSLCDRCADAVQLNRAHLDVDSVTMTNVRYGFEFYDSSAVVRRSVVNHAVYGIYSYCGAVQVDRVMGVELDYGVYALGCGANDSLVADSVSLTNGIYGFYANQLRASIKRSTVTDYQYGIYHNDSALVANQNVIVRPRSYGILVTVRQNEPVQVRDNAVTCDAYGASNAHGLDIRQGQLSVLRDTVRNCNIGIRFTSSSTNNGLPSVIGQNVVSTSFVTSAGIVLEGYRESARVLRNTVTGPTIDGAIRVGYQSGSLSTPRVVVDSNLVDGARRAGIIAFNVDTLRIRDNVIQNLAGGPCCISGGGVGGAIKLVHSDSSNKVAEVLRNRITDTHTSGIVLEQGANDSIDIVVDSNTVKRADSVGIWVRDYKSATLSYNAIESAALDAVQISRNNSTATSGPVILSFNNFSGSGRYGVNNIGSFEVIDAFNNYWNDPAGPRGFYGNQGSVTGDSVSNYVTWNPPLASPATTPLPAPPAMPVATYSLGMTAPAARLAASNTSATPVAVRSSGPTRPVAKAQAARAVRPTLPRFAPGDAPRWVSQVLARDAVVAADRAVQEQRAAARGALRAARVKARDAREAAAAAANRQGGTR